MEEDLAGQVDRFDEAVLRRDPEIAERVLHADYALVLVQPTPATMPRSRWLEVLPDYVVHDYAVEERTTDGWRVWRRHSSPATAGEMPGA